MDMITVEAAERSLTIACGAFILVLTLIAAAAWYFTIVFVNREKKASQKREKANENRIRREYAEELRKKGAASFVTQYEANERIKELERQLENTQDCLRALQVDYHRLQDLCARAKL